MVKYYELGEENRIAITSEIGRLVEQEDGSISMEGETFDFPDDFPFERQHDYKLIDGGLIYDPVPVEAQELNVATWDDLAAALAEGVNSI